MDSSDFYLGLSGAAQWNSVQSVCDSYSALQHLSVHTGKRCLRPLNPREERQHPRGSEIFVDYRLMVFILSAFSLQMITVGLIVQFIRAMIKIRSCHPVGIRSVSPFTCKGNMSSTQGGDMRLFRAAYLFQYGRITGHYIINKAADRHVYQADRKVYCFAYLVHDAQANYSAAKMHAIPLSLLFLQPTFLDYFVPRSCASTMVVEHAHMRCPPYL